MKEPSEILTQKKLSLLFLLDKANMSLTEEQLYSVSAALDLYNYFDLALQLTEFIENHLIEMRQAAAYKLYTISNTGRETVSMFRHRIPASRQDHLQEYLEANRLELKRAMHFHATLFKMSDTEFRVELFTIEDGAEVLRMVLTVGTNEMAQRIIMNWETDNEAIYESVMEKLLLGR